VQQSERQISQLMEMFRLFMQAIHEAEARRAADGYALAQAISERRSADAQQNIQFCQHLLQQGWEVTRQHNEALVNFLLLRDNQQQQMFQLLQQQRQRTTIINNRQVSIQNRQLHVTAGEESMRAMIPSDGRHQRLLEDKANEAADSAPKLPDAPHLGGDVRAQERHTPESAKSKAAEEMIGGRYLVTYFSESGLEEMTGILGEDGFVRDESGRKIALKDKSIVCCELKESDTRATKKHARE